MGIGRRIEAPVIESAGRAMGPTTAFHQRPQSDSESRCTKAGEEIAAMNDLEGDRDTIHKVGTQSEIGSTLREHLQEMQGDLDSSIADLAEARDSTAYAFRTAARQEAKAKTAETR